MFIQTCVLLCLFRPIAVSMCTWVFVSQKKFASAASNVNILRPWLKHCVPGSDSCVPNNAGEGWWMRAGQGGGYLWLVNITCQFEWRFTVQLILTKLLHVHLVLTHEWDSISKSFANVKFYNFAEFYLEEYNKIYITLGKIKFHLLYSQFRRSPSRHFTLFPPCNQSMTWSYKQFFPVNSSSINWEG